MATLQELLHLITGIAASLNKNCCISQELLPLAARIACQAGDKGLVDAGRLNICFDTLHGMLFETETESCKRIRKLSDTVKSFPLHVSKMARLIVDDFKYKHSNTTSKNENVGSRGAVTYLNYLGSRTSVTQMC